mmetsp:Transcript_3105/g.7299  ORF Transcript_3105/g.7299 Transcript_3105/m.7299 type:complete len:212 (+) Transcript_3105:235-870(+)
MISVKLAFNEIIIGTILFDSPLVFWNQGVPRHDTSQRANPATHGNSKQERIFAGKPAKSLTAKNITIFFNHVMILGIPTGRSLFLGQVLPLVGKMHNLIQELGQLDGRKRFAASIDKRGDPIFVRLGMDRFSIPSQGIQPTRRSGGFFHVELVGIENIGQIDLAVLARTDHGLWIQGTNDLLGFCQFFFRDQIRLVEQNHIGKFDLCHHED